MQESGNIEVTEAALYMYTDTTSDNKRPGFHRHDAETADF